MTRIFTQTGFFARCCSGGSFSTLSRAAARAAGARLRSAGVLRREIDWAGRASACERCPLRVVHRGKSYCGTPFLLKPQRDPRVDGCGCPTLDKAKDPGEHCPFNTAMRPALQDKGLCNCKWCMLHHSVR
jgi:hypothetical protein